MDLTLELLSKDRTIEKEELHSQALQISARTCEELVSGIQHIRKAIVHWKWMLKNYILEQNF